MKRVIAIFLAILPILCIQASNARKVSFIYIAHDVETPVVELVKKLDRYRDYARQDPSYQVIFYLANQGRPIVMQINPREYNQGDYKLLIQELYDRDFHNPLPDADVDNIVDIFQGIRIDSSDSVIEELSMSFFVTPSFFAQGFNESIIARLYYVLALDELSANETGMDFTLEVFYPKGHRPSYMLEEPFGALNLGGINEKYKSSVMQM